MTTLSDNDRRAFAANVRKFYVFRALVNFQLWLPIWVVYLVEERDLTLAQVTALDAPFWLVMVVMEVPTGAIADRWGRKFSLISGAALYTLTILAFGLATNFPLLLASYLLWGIAWTLFSGADAAFLYDSLRAIGRENEYQKIMGRARAVVSLASLGGLLLGAPLANLTALWFPVALSSVFIFAAWVVTLTFREPPSLREGETRVSYGAGIKRAARVVVGTPDIRYMILLAATVMAASTGMSILGQPFLVRHNVDISLFGVLLVPGQLLGVAAALGAYRLTATIGTRRVIVALPLILVGVAAGLGLWDSMLAFALYPLNGMVLALAFPVVSDYVNRRIPGAQRATILSFQQLVLSLTIAPLEPLLGAVADSLDLPAAYRTVVAFLLFVSLPILWLWLRATRVVASVEVSEPLGSAEPEADQVLAAR